MGIAGDPPTLASVQLGVPNASVVAHPHYEEPDARKRFKDMKEYFFACASAQDAHSYATGAGITHLLLDMTKIEPTQAVALSRFYKKQHRCRDDMGRGLLGMQRTFFQIVLDRRRFFKPLHVVGSYFFVQVLQHPGSDAAADASVSTKDP